MSSTAQGAEILDDYGWEATLSPLGSPTGLCIPGDIEKFVAVRLPVSFMFWSTDGLIVDADSSLE